MLNWASADELKSEQQLVKKFEEENPGVEVDFENVPTNPKEKVLTRIAAGNPPDVFLLDSVHLPAFFRNEFLLDLMPFVDEFNVDLDIFFPNVLEIGMQDSRLLAIPKDFNPLMMFYNKDLFDQAGVSYPETGWTWNDFVDVCLALTRDTNNDGRTDIYGTTMDLRFLFWQPWLWVAGGDILNPEGTSSSGYFDSQASIRAISFIADLTRRHEVTPSAQALKRQGLQTNLFFTGRIGTIVTGHWMVSEIRKYVESGDLRIGAVHIPVPADGFRKTVMYEAGWCVPKGVKNQALSVKLAFFLGGEYAARIRAQSGIAIPAIRKVAEEQRAADSWGVEEAFFNEIPFCRQPWGTRIEEFRKIELAAEDAMASIVNRDHDVVVTLTNAAAEIDRILDDSKRLHDAKGGLSSQTLIWIFLIGTCSIAILGLISVVVRLKQQERGHFFRGMGFLLPSFILLIVFVMMPLVFSLFLSAHQWDIINSSKPFVGLQNYWRLLNDPQFWNAFWNTALFTLQVPIGMFLSLMVALLMSQKLKWVSLLRTIYFLPSVTSFVAIALVWQWMYHPQFGLANYLLDFIGLGPYPWLTNPGLALVSVMIMTIWMGIGYQMVIFLAGLQGIPEYLYEAATIDGATTFQRFWHITIPQLMPTTFFVLVTSVIGSFQVFAPIFVMTEGGPARSTDVLMYHIYQNAWEYLRMGEASAMSWVLFLIILVATYLQFRLLGRQVEYS